MKHWWLFLCIFSRCTSSSEQRFLSSLAPTLEEEFPSVKIVAKGYREQTYYIDFQANEAMDPATAQELVASLSHRLKEEIQGEFFVSLGYKQDGQICQIEWKYPSLDPPILSQRVKQPCINSQST